MIVVRGLSQSVTSAIRATSTTASGFPQSRSGGRTVSCCRCRGASETVVGTSGHLVPAAGEGAIGPQRHGLPCDKVECVMHTSRMRCAYHEL